MGLRFEIVLTVEVEEDANFLSVDESSTLEVVKEKISDCVYDLDDVEILESDITRRIDWITIWNCTVNKLKNLLLLNQRID